MYVLMVWLSVAVAALAASLGVAIGGAFMLVYLSKALRG
jgi:hypothetical protein